MSITQEQAQQMLEKGEKIEQEFAEYFTGEREVYYAVGYFCEVFLFRMQSFVLCFPKHNKASIDVIPSSGNMVCM